MTLKNRPKWQLILIGTIVAFIALFIFPFSAWLVAEEGFKHTSNAEFCTSCHTMEPFEAAYFEDVHGGNSSHGVQATCTDCHLNHDSAGAYFFNKAQTGIHDMWVENFGDLESIDWEGNRAHREDYVYDSGCLNCHNNLENATKGSNKAFVAHHDYFSGKVDNKCVSCHEHVGHKNLGFYISGKS